MKLFYSFSIILFFCFTTSAQNWQTINSNTKSIFLNDDPNDIPIVGLKADSVKVLNGDSTFFLYKTFKKFQYCFLNSDPKIWAGDSVVVKANGENVYYPSGITIHTQAKLNDKWQIVQFSNGNYLEATVISEKVETVLDVIDSVKIIQIRSFDLVGQPNNHWLNNFELIISKNFGLVKTFNFNTFSKFSLNLYRLRPPTVKEIYAFEIGDVIQKELSTFYNNGNPSYITTNTHVIKNKIEGQDSIVYISTIYSNSVDSNSAIDDTLTVNKIDSLFVSYMPEEGFVTINSMYSLNVVHYDTICSGNLQIKTLSDHRFSFHPDSCFNIIGIADVSKIYGYAEGLGEIYITKNLLPTNSIYKFTSRMLFYNKGSDSCGTRITTGINTSRQIEFKVYPNPANDILFISFPENPEPVTIEIFDLTGALILTEKFSSSRQINIQALKPGLYLYKISQKDKESIGKLVVQK